MTTELKTIGESLYEIAIQKSILMADVIKKKQEISALPQYKELQTLENDLREMETKEAHSKTVIKEQMISLGIKSIDTTKQKITVKSNPGAVKIVDEGMIPDWYWITKTDKQLDKKQIKADIENGASVPGAEVEKSFTLLISSRND